MLSQLKMEDLNDNELGFTLGLETNSLFNDELNLNSISHDYIKNGDDLFLTNDENWLSSLDSDENAFNHSLTNQQTNINQQNELNRNNQELNQTNSLLIKKKRKLECDNNFGILNNEVGNVIEISEIDTNQRLKSVDNKLQLNQKEFNKLDLNKKATKLLGKPIKNEYVQEQFYQEKENNIKEELESDQEELDNDLDEDEEIDELLRFPVSSSILDDQCGSPTELNQLNNLLHDSDSGSVFDDGYLSATSTFNLNTNSQLLNENRRQLKSTNLLCNQTQNNGTSNDQLYQVHNYSCIKQDKFLHSANNQQLLNTADNQLIYLKHDGFLNGNSNYTSSNSSLSGGSQSSSPTQSPKARKSNYGRRQIKGGNLITNDEQRQQNLNKSSNQQTIVTNLKSQQQQQQTNGRGSRFKPITDLHLTDEERRLLNKEGYVNFPSGDNPQLSKMEEKILRKIRRKIRNKRSAQCSRQRKKEYLEELEKKYSNCTNEVQSLKSEVLKLRREKVSLISKIQKLMCSVDNQQQQQQQLELNDDKGESLPEITCGENIQINNKIIIKSNQKTQLDQQNLDNQLANDNLVLNNDELSNNELNECLVNNIDNLEIDYLLTSNDDNLQFDFDNFNNNFEISDLKDDGLLNYVNNFTNNDNQLIVENSNQLIDYHQQAPVKTSLFLLVFFIVLMFVPFLRLDVLDNSLEALENQIGQHSNELISSNQQLTAIL